MALVGCLRLNENNRIKHQMYLNSCEVLGKSQECRCGFYQLTGSHVASPGCVVGARQFFQMSSLIHVEWLVGGASAC